MDKLPFPLLSEEQFPQEMEQVTLRLDQLRQASGHCERQPDQGIYWEYYAPDAGCDKVILISHGFTESATRFYEMTWYFLRAGYGVFLCDHMGHGRSYRLISENWLTHSVSFSEYIEDLHHLVHKVILPMSKDKKHYLYGHSMGGAIAILYLEEYPGDFDKAVLSSPMVSPSAGPMPDFLGGALASVMCVLGQGEKPIPIQAPYDGKDHWEDQDCSTSTARYHWYLDEQRKHPYLQNSTATYSWAKEAANVQYPILAQAYMVQIPVLLCQAGLDTIVNNGPQDDLVSLLPQGRKIVYHDAKHEIYRSCNPALGKYLLDVLNFLDE